MQVAGAQASPVRRKRDARGRGTAFDPATTHPEHVHAHYLALPPPARGGAPPPRAGPRGGRGRGLHAGGGRGPAQGRRCAWTGGWTRRRGRPRSRPATSRRRIPTPARRRPQRTEVRVLDGADALYVGARMFDPPPDSIAAPAGPPRRVRHLHRPLAPLHRRHHDRRTAFHFAVNPRGVKQDVYHFDDNREDVSRGTPCGTWPRRWTRWGGRRSSASPTRSCALPRGWAATRAVGRAAHARHRAAGRARHLVAVDAQLAGLRLRVRRRCGGCRRCAAPTRLEIMPYTSARLDARAGRRGRTPSTARTTRARPWAPTCSYGLPGGLTLTATLNPDFGQVEVDPAVVNLSAFETQSSRAAPVLRGGQRRVPLRRPAGAQLVTGRRSTSTRAASGGTPQRARARAPDIAFVDVPEQSHHPGRRQGERKDGQRLVGGGAGRRHGARSRRAFARGAGASGTLARGAPEQLLRGAGAARPERRGARWWACIVTATHRDLSDSMLRRPCCARGVRGRHGRAARVGRPGVDA